MSVFVWRYTFTISLYDNGVYVLSPGPALSTHSVADSGTVALLEAVDEYTVQTRLTLLETAVFLEATGPARHTPGIFSITKATFLEGLKEKKHTRVGAAGVKTA